MNQSIDRRVGKKVQFFKILIGDFSEKLRIPPKVVYFLSDKASKRAVLQGPTGCIWEIKLRKAINDWYIMDGWTDFVRDHSLKESDLLVFKYDGITHFKVKIFDQYACEKDILSPKFQNEGKRKRKRPTKHQAEIGVDACDAEIGVDACDDDLLGDEDASSGSACKESICSKGSKKQRYSSKNSLEYGCVYEHEACINGLLQGLIN
ncbi:B3 domain-containing protein [Acorus gramineus]|uniref:B3 domain-containing protein n=1 Tax=Acorus gramineus TaxID=55184 RepID=A0AAV9A6N8_ACOGR|nr:B3 domain-containing protein [Acorus gramineus]